MQNKEWFCDWFNSHYYHKLYSNRSNEEATSFIEKLVAFLAIEKGSKILDIACGKGRHSIALNQLGFSVTGIDLSSESIKEASLSSNENLQFFEHDMRLPFYVNYFDFAFNFFTSFGYFKTQREHNNTIASFSKSLKQNGILVIDYLNVHIEEKAPAQLFEKQIDDITFVISKWQNETHFLKQIQFLGKNGLPKQLSTEKVSKFSLDNFKEMLNLQGFNIQHVFGDYNLNLYHPNTSKRLIIVAKKDKI